MFSSIAVTGLRRGSGLLTICARSMSAVPNYSYECLQVTQPKEFVYHVELNRPDKRNALSLKLMGELVECFDKISTDGDCRAVVLSGAGKMFCAGIDLMDLAKLSQTELEDTGRKAFEIRKFVAPMQAAMSSAEKCLKPVIAAVHNGCVGAGVDFTTACDMRYCSEDAFFQVKEVDVGLAADIGTLQRLPKIIGNQSLVRELAFTARKMPADEAKAEGLVNKVFSDHKALLEGAVETAAFIASKSPIAVQGTKVNLLYARDHSVEDGLNYVATWNQSMLQSEDLMKAAMGAMTKQDVTFSKL